MAGTTSKGAPTFANTDAADFANDLTAVSTWASGKIGESAAAAGSLPSPALWAGRTITAVDTSAMYLSDGAKWYCLFSPLTSYTPTFTGLTVGAGGSTVASWSRSGATVSWRVLITLGTAPVVNDVFISLPIACASSGSATNVTLLGDATYVDTSAGSSGRHRGSAARGASVTTARLLSGTDPMGGVVAAVPFTWASGDQISVTGTYLTDVN